MQEQAKRIARCALASAMLAGCLLPSLGAAAAERAPVNTPEAAITLARKTWAELYQKGSWLREFSERETARFAPYSATLHQGVWTVRGTIPPACHGVTLVTTVQQSDGLVQVQVIDCKSS